MRAGYCVFSHRIYVSSERERKKRREKRKEMRNYNTVPPCTGKRKETEEKKETEANCEKKECTRIVHIVPGTRRLQQGWRMQECYGRYAQERDHVFSLQPRSRRFHISHVWKRRAFRLKFNPKSLAEMSVSRRLPEYLRRSSTRDRRGKPGSLCRRRSRDRAEERAREDNGNGSTISCAFDENGQHLIGHLSTRIPLFSSRNNCLVFARPTSPGFGRQTL